MAAIEAADLGRAFRIPDPNAPWYRQLLGLGQFVPGLEGVTLTVAEGERVALLGRNGSGKSTLQKLVAGVIAPTSGRLAVLGESPSHRSRGFLRRLGIMFGQKSLLFTDLTVNDALGLYRIVYGLSDDDYQSSLARLDEHLDFLRLADRPVRKLSLGERMRCELAAALLHEPDLVLLDEPTIGVDSETEAGLIALLQSPTYADSTLLLTTHNTNLARAVCDRLVVLEHGHVREDLDAGEVWQVGAWVRYDVRIRAGATPVLTVGRVHALTADGVTVDAPASGEARLRDELARDPAVLGFSVSATPLDALLAIARDADAAEADVAV